MSSIPKDEVELKKQTNTNSKVDEDKRYHEVGPVLCENEYPPLSEIKGIDDPDMAYYIEKNNCGTSTDEVMERIDKVKVCREKFGR